jgi:intracellular sulfur oxidation DsrE/DsrF family protein
MKPHTALLAALVTLGAANLVLAQTAPREEGGKFLYEIPSRSSARVVLRAVEKHIAESRGRPRIAVVAHGGGVESMLAGARDEYGAQYAPAVVRLGGKGVDFAVCGATLKLRRIDPRRVLAQGRIVDGGNSEIARLASEGYLRLN